MLNRRNDHDNPFCTRFPPPVAMSDDRDWLTALVAHSQDAIIGETPDGIITSWNPAAERMYGFQESEVLGKSIEIIVPEDRRNELHRTLAAIRAGRNVPSFETHRLARNGALLTVLLTLSPVRDLRGRIIGISTIARDISQQKQRQQREHELLEFQQRLLDTAVVWIHTIDLQGRITLWNPAAERISGYKSEKMFGNPDIWSVLVPDADARARTRTILHDLVKEGVSVEGIETAIQSRSGQMRVMSWYANAITNRDGEVVGCMGVGVDVTERKQAERIVQENEERFRTFFHRMSSGGLILKRRGPLDFVVHDINREARAIENLPNDSLVGRALIEVFSAEEQAHVSRVLESVWTSGVPRRLPISLRNEEGLSRFLDCRLSRLPSGETVIIYDDVTQRRLARRKLMDYQHQLRRLSHDLELSGEHERRKLAADLHDHIGQKLAISKMKLGVLKLECGASAEMANEIEKIHRLVAETAEDVHTLTFQLHSPQLFSEGLEVALFSLSEQILAENDIHCDISSFGNVDAIGDTQRILLYRTVRELLYNVVKHAAASRVEVTLFEDAGAVSVMVADNGHGFDLERIERHDNRAGGFGLFNVRERIGYMGGRVEIDTAPGAGCSVSIHLPAEMEREHA